MAAEHNPYTPPQSAVAEFETAEPRVRPWSVLVAIVLIFINAAMGAAGWLRHWRTMLGDEFGSVFFAWQLAKWAVIFVICYQIWRGRNWARVVFLVLTVFGLFSLLMRIWAMSTQIPAGVKYMPDPMGWVSMSLPVLLSLAALLLLYLPARHWFRSRAQAG
jgi:hypothetical protein